MEKFLIICVSIIIKKSALPHILALLNNCLPGTSFEVALEHAIQYKRKKEAEDGKKNNKQKSDQIDEEDEDYGNIFKQIKDQIDGNFKKI